MAESMRKSPYQMIGGEAGVERLVKTFYDIVESDPAGASLMVMHNQGHGLAHAREAQFEFLSGFLGGPQLNLERHRHSNVRRMHAHLSIGTVERDSWLICMEKALTVINADPETRNLLMGHFSRVADALRTHVQNNGVMNDPDCNHCRSCQKGYILRGAWRSLSPWCRNRWA